MNETINTIISRRNIKGYTDQMVSDHLLNEITTAATYSASGMNKQAAMMIVVKDKTLRDKLSALNASILVPLIFSPIGNTSEMPFSLDSIA